MYNYRELNSSVDINNLHKDLEARDEYLRFVNDNFLKSIIIFTKEYVTGVIKDNLNELHLNDEVIDKVYLSVNRFWWLCQNGYYSNFFKYYSNTNIIKLLYLAYSHKFEYKSYMSVFTFYNDYALKSDDKKTFYENYEDAIVGLSMYLAKTDFELASEFITVLIKQEYQPATPTFLNARKKKRGEMISCFLLDINDSLTDIMFQISQAAQLSKIGGGVALNLSKLRSRGESIKDIVNSTKGVVPVMKLLENTFNYVDQMGQRKGAGVAYLNIFHYDIMEFLDTKKINADEKSRIQTLSLGVIIPNKFMDLCKNNEKINMFAPYSVFKAYNVHLDDMNMDEMYEELSNNPDVIKKSMNARELLNIVAEIQFESGYPYLMFRDNANNVNPLKEIESITMTNLCCFSGDTKVRVNGELKRLDSLVGEEFEVVSAEPFTEVRNYYHNQTEVGHWKFSRNKAKAYHTGVSRLIRVTLSNGDYFDCTEDHRLALHGGGYIEAENSLGSYLCNREYYIPDDFYDKTKIYKVVSVEPLKVNEGECEYQDTYCLEVENNHNFIIEGQNGGQYLVHNCEIFQSQKTSSIDDDKDSIGFDVNCILGSLNIVNVMDNKSIESSVSTAIKMLTQVTDNSNIKNAPTVKKANDLFHSVGLGAMNLHGYLLKNLIPYESEEAKDFCNIFFMMVNYYSLKTSMLIAKDRKTSFYGFNKSEYKNGNYFNQYIHNDIAPETERVSILFKEIYIPTKNDWIELKGQVQKYGLYHSYRLAIAPTGNISYLQNSTQSIMPITQKIEPRTSNDKVTYYPMPFLTKDNALFYKVAYDMDMKKMIDLVSVIQKHVDQGISTTLFVKSDLSTRGLQQLYIHAYKNGLKSLYYTRIKNISIVEECISCAV